MRFVFHTLTALTVYVNKISPFSPPSSPPSRAKNFIRNFERQTFKILLHSFIWKLEIENWKSLRIELIVTIQKQNSRNFEAAVVVVLCSLRVFLSPDILVVCFRLSCSKIFNKPHNARQHEKQCVVPPQRFHDIMAEAETFSSSSSNETDSTIFDTENTTRLELEESLEKNGEKNRERDLHSELNQLKYKPICPIFKRWPL